MKVFTAIGFKGHCPLSTSAVIVAETKAKAFRLICDELKDNGLLQKKKDFKVEMLEEIKLTKPFAKILLNGNYVYDGLDEFGNDQTTLT